MKSYLAQDTVKKEANTGMKASTKQANEKGGYIEKLADRAQVSDKANTELGSAYE